VEDWEYNRTICLRDAQSLTANIQLKLRTANDYAHRISLLKEGSGDPATEQLKKILHNPFWKFASIKTPIITFKTSTAIVMSERNTAAGIDRTVNLGKYFVDIKITNGELKVRKAENNLTVSGHWHPYVGSGGDVCWGNASDTAHDKLSRGQYGDVMDLLAALLVTYSPEATPYMRLADFAVAAQLRQAQNRGGVATPEPEVANVDEDICGQCRNHQDDCECYYCERCDDSYTNRCDEHWCPICETDDRLDCGCCPDCNQVSDDCDRCRTCDRHSGRHDHDCTERPRETASDEPTF
jgi:hypothetical protein